MDRNEAIVVFKAHETKMKINPRTGELEVNIGFVEGAIDPSNPIVQAVAKAIGGYLPLKPKQQCTQTWETIQLLRLQELWGHKVLVDQAEMKVELLLYQLKN